MQLVIWVGTGIRPGTTDCVNVCCWTVMLPLEVAAMACICWVTQAVAAPMPRTGSVWLDAVCRVPNCVSRSIVAWIRSGSTWRSSARRAGSGSCRASAGLALARVVLVRMGAATAVTAEADRNARRVVPLRGGRTSSFLDMLRINDVLDADVNTAAILACARHRSGG